MKAYISLVFLEDWKFTQVIGNELPLPSSSKVL